MDALTKTAIQATLHCLTGCAVGEVLGMVIANALSLHGLIAVILSVVLAFLFGYSFTLLPLLRSDIGLKKAARIALASDTISITSMEIVDNAIIVIIPGALLAGLTTGLFWGSLAVSLLIAFIVTVPVNRWLISRGKGHAVVHAMHQQNHH